MPRYGCVRYIILIDHIALLEWFRSIKMDTNASALEGRPTLEIIE